MKKHAFKLGSLLGVALALALFAPQRAKADDDDPPTRVARLSHTDGSVSFEPAGTDDWVAANINRPMTTGDKVWSDNGSRAELHIGSASIRLGSTTGFSFLNLSDQVAQLQVTEGTVRVRVKRLEQDETFEIDTPNLAFSILRPGTYKIDVNEAGDTTVVTVSAGEGEVTGGGQAYAVHANQTATFQGTDQLSADLQDLGDYDDFDRWCADRDRREDHSTSGRYVSSDVIGYEDLDEYGGWRDVPEYGTIWFPHTTVVGWAPYRYGHWAYIAPWGYTWVEDEPWGFAPFHYGRWVTVGGVWGWVPSRPAVVGVAYVRPVYAPALVAWVGGPHVAVGIAVGGGVGWFALGPREVYVPSYRVSRNYVNNVNVSNTTVNTTVVNNYYNTTVVNKNVTNVTYVNQRVPGAVTATSTTAFTTAQPVRNNMVKVDQKEITRASAGASAPTVAPSRQAVLGGGQVAKARPPATLATRTVVAKRTPPPTAPTFEKQQVAIRENGGRPLAISQERQLQPANTQAAASANVKIAPPTKQVTPIAPRSVQANRPGQPPPNAGNQPAQPQNNAAIKPVPPGNNRPGQPPPNVGNQPAQPQNNAAIKPVPPGNNRPITPAPATPNNAGNKPGNPPANSPANVNQRSYSDRPSPSPPANQTAPATVNPQLEQRQQQQVENLRKQQDQQRQRVEQQQEADHQRAAQQKAGDQRKQQVEQQHQQQLEQLEKQHDQQKQQLEERQRVQQQQQRAPQVQPQQRAPQVQPQQRAPQVQPQQRAPQVQPQQRPQPQEKPKQAEKPKDKDKPKPDRPGSH